MVRKSIKPATSNQLPVTRQVPRISGVNIPDNKRVEIALTYIFGIGPTLSKKLLTSTKIDPDKKAKDLTNEEINKIQLVLEKDYKTEGSLKREIMENIKRLREIGSWRGMRHARKLPLHGRSRVNSRTLRGNLRKTMGSGRTKAASPT